MTHLYHLALASDWASAQATGRYTMSTLGRTIEQVGFLHACGDLEQVTRVVERFYGDVDEALVLLTIDSSTPAFAGLQVRIEPAVPDDPVAATFPHVYGGELPIDTVTNATPYARAGTTSRAPRPSRREDDMTTSTHASEHQRSVSLTRTGAETFRALNARGGTLDLGSGADADFTPVELLLAAIAGCSAIDVDLITSRRAEPTQFDVEVSGEKLKDDQGNHLDDLQVSFRVRFPDGEPGESAREMLPRAIAMSHDRLCTVSRTVQLGSPVTMSEH